MARALEVLGDRWSLLIVRELHSGRQHFNQIERALLRIEGAPELRRAFPTWFQWPALPAAVRPRRLRPTGTSGR